MLGIVQFDCSSSRSVFESQDSSEAKRRFSRLQGAPVCEDREFAARDPVKVCVLPLTQAAEFVSSPVFASHCWSSRTCVASLNGVNVGFSRAGAGNIDDDFPWWSESGLGNVKVIGCEGHMVVVWFVSPTPMMDQASTGSS